MQTDPNQANDQPSLTIIAAIENRYPLSEALQQTLSQESIFLKVAVQATLSANWDKTAEAHPPLHHISLEIAYPDSKGILVWRNTAPYAMDEQKIKEAVPCIWDAETKDRKYQFAFTYHQDYNDILIRSSVRFDDPNLPEVKQQFSLPLSAVAQINKQFDLLP